jgi:hypothetical protein
LRYAMPFAFGCDDVGASMAGGRELHPSEGCNARRDIKVELGTRRLFFGRGALHERGRPRERGPRRRGRR